MRPHHAVADPQQTLAQECAWIGCAAAIVAMLALAYSTRHGMLLLYGDAVAHLHIARRIGDSLYPGFRQLGSVWLPLPHLLMYPFAQSMRLWETGLAGAPPSIVAYIFGVAGMYRLARFALRPALASIATLFFALNPNLLYLQTTAMTEPIFLAEMVWAAVFVAEHARATREAAGDARERALRNNLLGLALVLVAAVFTRYDGWVYAALAWCFVVWSTLRSGAWRGRSGQYFVLGTALVVAAPVFWLCYNAKQFGDPLDFMRGPYSAAAIDARSSAHGAGHYPGWHKPWIAVLYFVKAAELDSTTYWAADGLLVASLAGTWIALRRHKGLLSVFALFWLPVPFYAYSVAFGSVPIFMPRWYPNGWYNTRYGMELLPVFALGMGFVSSALAAWMQKRQPKLAPYAVGSLAVLLLANDVWMVREVPLVVQEAQVNSHTRIAFETSLAKVLVELPPEGLILMYTSDHVGAVQDAGIALQRTVNDSDWLLWQNALKDPAHAARFAVAMDGDPLAEAIRLHPEGLRELDVICSQGQPCARIYQSTVQRRY